LIRSSVPTGLRIQHEINVSYDSSVTSLDGADEILSSVLKMARFWQAQANASFNERQRNMINRLFEPRIP
jgi:hypothetical protein